MGVALPRRPTATSSRCARSTRWRTSPRRSRRPRGCRARPSRLSCRERSTARSRRSGGSSRRALIAGLARIVRDVGLAEDLAQDALVARWSSGRSRASRTIPGAWLMATAKHRAIDLLRRRTRLERKHEELARELELQLAMPSRPGSRRRSTTEVGDDLLRLIFMCCHPVLSTEARVALTLRLLGGLRTEEIARAFLVSESTVAQRIVRAKRTLAEARVPFEVPARRGAGRAPAPRCSRSIYLIFNEGYAATARRGLDAARALRGGAAPRPHPRRARCRGEPEVHGLVALMEIQASRARARVGPAGEPVLLLDQDRARWDRLLIAARPGGARARGAARRRARPLRAAGRDRRLPRPGRAPPRTPTGRASPRSTTRSPSSPRRRSSSSTARWRSRWRSARPRGWSWSTRSLGEPSLERLPPAAERARRPAGPARPLPGGAGRARARRLARGQRARAPAAARPRQGVRMGGGPLAELGPAIAFARRSLSVRNACPQRRLTSRAFMNLAPVLPLAFVMVAGPQFISAVFFATSEKWKGDSATFVAGSRLAMRAGKAREQGAIAVHVGVIPV